MAIQWGSPVSGSGIRAQLGIEVQGTDTGAPVRVVVYLWTSGRASDNHNTLTVSGSHSYSGTVPVNIGAGGGTIQLAVVDAAYPARYGSAHHNSVSASLTGFIGGSPTVSTSYTVPAKPYLPPRPVTNLNAVRQNRTIRVSWHGLTDGWDDAQPVTTHWIGRQTDGRGAWINVANVPWDTYSWVDNGVELGHSYAYQVYAGNTAYRGAGAAQWSPVATSGVVYSAPLAPGNATATRNGGNIVVSWVNRQSIGNVLFEVGEGEKTLTSTPISGTSFTIPSPSAAEPHTYWVRAVLAGAVSEKTLTNPIQLAAAPYAPSRLTSGWLEQGKPVKLSWQHNPADGSAQTRYQIRWRAYGANVWNELASQNSTDSTATLPASTATGALEWSVRTWGQDATKPGAWAEPALIQFEKAVTVSIISPTGRVTADTSTVTASATGAQGAFSWEISWGAPGTETRTRTGIVTSGSVFSALIDGLENGKKYTVTARARAHVWGDRATREISVVYAAPPKATLDVLADLDRGAVSLTPRPGRSSPGDPSVTRTDVQRLEGDSWVTLFSGVDFGSAVVDPVPPLGGVVRYRAVTFASNGTSAAGDSFIADMSAAKGIHLNWGRGLGEHLVLKYNPKFSESPSLMYQSTYHFAGNLRPVAIVGVERDMKRSFSASVLPSDTHVVDTLRSLAFAGALVHIRTGYQRLRTTGLLSGLKIDVPTTGSIGISFTHEESD